MLTDAELREMRRKAGEMGARAIYVGFRAQEERKITIEQRLAALHRWERLTGAPPPRRQA